MGSPLMGMLHASHGKAVERLEGIRNLSKPRGLSLKCHVLCVPLQDKLLNEMIFKVTYLVARFIQICEIPSNNQILSGYIPVGHLCLAPHQHRMPSLWWSMGAPYPRRSASATWWTHRWDDGSKFLWAWHVRTPTCSTFFLEPLGTTLGSWWQIPLL